MLMGLSRKLRLPSGYDVDQLKTLKLAMQERVMQLWNEH